LIYPTPRAAILAALGGPLALIAGVYRDDLWIVGAWWCCALIFACIIDAILGKGLSETTKVNNTYPNLSIARPESWTLACDFGKADAPKMVSAALECDDRFGLEKVVVSGVSAGSVANFDFRFNPLRRGKGLIKSAFVRWQGPLGLVWKQKHLALDHESAVSTNIRGIQEDALAWFSRYAMFGTKLDRTIGEGTEFHALREFQTGMDRRTVDWKQSARHAKLLAKEFRSERNHNIVFALDAGRTMCEPIGAAPRIDRAIEAALLTAMACLRGGDKAGLFAFDAKPRRFTGALGGGSAIATLQQCASDIDYCAEETNYVFGLATLSGELRRRSLIIVFTEFADQTAAQLMIEALGRLLKRHLVVFVSFKDEELEALQDGAPNSAEDVSRAVVAASILTERGLVLAKLRAMGVHIVEGYARTIGPDVISKYLDLKAKDLL
jgi:uncharacterized protein (DUF58 family)